MNNSIMEAAMLDMAEQGLVRDERGRFVPGRSGNPAGKAPGTRNRATVLRAALEGKEGPAMARVIIDKALSGDVVTARFCIARLEPRPRSRAIEIDLPEGARARDIVAAFDETVRAMAAGEITPDEAVQVTRVLDGRRKAIEAAWREERDGRRDSARSSVAGRDPSTNAQEADRTRPASTGAGLISSARAHPLPREEGMAGAPPSARVIRARAAASRADLLHSTCIYTPNPLPGWLASASAPGFRSTAETAR